VQKLSPGDENLRVTVFGSDALPREQRGVREAFSRAMLRQYKETPLTSGCCSAGCSCTIVGARTSILQALTALIVPRAIEQRRRDVDGQLRPSESKFE